MVRWGAIALAVVVWLWLWVPTAGAAVLCREVAGHGVCIESIQRSAKYLWEYRVVTTVDGQRQPLRVYDCRLPGAGQGDAFETAMAQFICGLVNR